MNRTLNAILGITLIITGVGGMLFSIAGIAGVWYFRPQALENLTANLQLASNALTTTSEGLEVANSSLSMTIESLDRLDQAITASGEALDSTTPMITSLTTLTRSELPATVETARTSLSSAQESARIIDSFLSALSFLPGIDYNPEVPLNESLAAVAASLDPIPESLETIETSLDTTGDNLQAIQSDMELMAADVREIRSGLQEAEQVIDRYGLPDPAAGQGVGQFTNTHLQQLYNDLMVQGNQSSTDALKVGVAIEEVDIADLQKYSAQTNRTDILQVYSMLMNGSYHHLNAFNTQLGQ